MGPYNFRHLLLITAAVFLLPSAAPDISSDRAALLSLRSAVGGRVLLWNLTSPTPCAWAGVTCSPENSTVVELRLPGMGLSGQIPANTISNLTSLLTLSLRYNSLSGPLPPDIFSSLSSLRNLYLQHNSFSGGIPDSLFSLSSSLVRMDLAANNFSGTISPAFNNLTRLAMLYLQDNKFSGPIPDMNLPGLSQFDVSNNNLTGRIPRGLSGKPKSSFAGNSLCGHPLDSCGDREKLSGGAIAGIVIGSVIGFFLIVLLLVLCLRRIMLSRSKDDEVTDEGREVEIPGERRVESDVVSEGNGGKKSLVYFGNSNIRGWDFDMEDLLRASAEVLGKGTFGTAYKAVVETGVAVVVKRLRDVCIGEKEFREKMVEIGRMEHHNLVPLRAYYYNRDEKLLVYEYMPMGSLSALLHGNKGVGGRTPLNWETRATIALGAARGISYVHSQSPPLSHGNIKSSNILLTKSYKARVSDFLLARLATADHHLGGGYQAPEVTDPHRASQKADVYSFGVVLLELLTCKAPTHEEGVDLPRWVQSVVREEWTNEVFDLELLRDRDVEEDMVQLLQLAVDCTAHYPDKRPPMPEVVAKIEGLCRWSAEDENEENGLDSGLSPV